MNENRIRHIVHEMLLYELRDVHVHLTIDNTTPIPVSIIDHQQSVAKTAILLLGGAHMPGQITVDTTNETATVGFLDDKGNTTAAPSGATVAFSSSDDTVLTVAADASNPFQADIEPVGLGSADVSVALSGALEADGVTPIADPTAVTVTVSPGAAASASFDLSV